MNNVRPHYRRRSLFGPLLVAAIGVVFLLRNVGVISYRSFGWWFSRYWPLILISWGIVKFAEYYWARSRNEPYPGIGGGSVVFVVFLILFGLGATGASHVHWNFMTDDPENDDWWLGMFGTRYDFTDSFAAPMPTGKEVRVLSTRGDITITPSPDDQAHVLVHKYLRGDSQDEANGFNNATHPKFEQQGSVWLLDLTGGQFNQGRFNLDVQVPARYSVSLLDRYGDVRVSQMQADVELETNHGNMIAEQIKGNVLLHAHRGDVTGKDITGSVHLDGDVGDSRFSDINGTLTMTGSFVGDVEISHVSNQVKFVSSRTDLQLAKLDGDLAMDRSDLKAGSLAGPFSLKTDAKEVNLENINGDVRIDDHNGNIKVESSGLGNMDISTTDGEISVKLPEKPGFQVNAESDGGEISSDFSLSINNEKSVATATGTVGQGGPQVKLRTNSGTIQIKKN